MRDLTFGVKKKSCKGPPYHTHTVWTVKSVTIFDTFDGLDCTLLITKPLRVLCMQFLFFHCMEYTLGWNTLRSSIPIYLWMIVFMRYFWSDPMVNVLKNYLVKMHVHKINNTTSQMISTHCGMDLFLCMLNHISLFMICIINQHILSLQIISG